MFKKLVQMGIQKLIQSTPRSQKVGPTIKSVKPNLKTETNVNFIAYGFVWDLAKYFIEENKNFKPDTFYQAINKESIQADFDAINKRELEMGSSAVASLVYLFDKYGLND